MTGYGQDTGLSLSVSSSLGQWYLPQRDRPPACLHPSNLEFQKLYSKKSRLRDWEISFSAQLPLLERASLQHWQVSNTGAPVTVTPAHSAGGGSVPEEVKQEDQRVVRLPSILLMRQRCPW